MVYQYRNSLSVTRTPVVQQRRYFGGCALCSFVFSCANRDISACVSSNIMLVIPLNRPYPLMYALFHLYRFLARRTASASFSLSPHSSGKSVTQLVPLFAFKVSSFSSVFKCQRSRATARTSACLRKETRAVNREAVRDSPPHKQKYVAFHKQERFGQKQHGSIPCSSLRSVFYVGFSTRNSYEKGLMNSSHRQILPWKQLRDCLQLVYTQEEKKKKNNGAKGILKFSKQRLSSAHSCI